MILFKIYVYKHTEKKPRKKKEFEIETNEKPFDSNKVWFQVKHIQINEEAV